MAAQTSILIPSWESSKRSSKTGYMSFKSKSNWVNVILKKDLPTISSFVRISISFINLQLINLKSGPQSSLLQDFTIGKSSLKC